MLVFVRYCTYKLELVGLHSQSVSPTCEPTPFNQITITGREQGTQFRPVWQVQCLHLLR